jgi:hypothetical protein
MTIVYPRVTLHDKGEIRPGVYLFSVEYELLPHQFDVLLKELSLAHSEIIRKKLVAPEVREEAP